MVLKSLGEAFGYLGKSPLVWTPGVAAAGIILLGYWLFQQIGILTASAVVFVLLFILPFLLAGTYGIISEETGSFSVFRRYAVTGYFRCLLPILLTFLLAYLFSQFIAYLLMLMGMSLMSAANIAMFIFIPVVFFCYFADVTAVVNNLRMFQSLKDSALRVMNGSFSIAVFYLVNVGILIVGSLAASFIWAALAADELLPLTQMTQEELLAMTQDELFAMMTSPEIVFASAMTLAVCALVLVPLFAAYKACYFKRTSPFLMAAAAPPETEGEYDEKGRWYKYT